MKAIGQSKKSDDTGLGSFGIGKFAPFTVSDLRTIFVSTVYTSNNEDIHYVQGKAILMSHMDENGGTHKGVGYWGHANRCQPVQGPHKMIPAWLRRTTLGTSLYILGFQEISGWENILAASIAQNFFGAIAYGKLEVSVGSIELNALSLKQFFFSEKELATSLQNQKEPEEFREAGLYHSTLSDEGIAVESKEHVNLGNCELRIRVGENLPKKVAILRNGMFITAELNQLKRFSDYKDFVAVFQCKSEKGNSLLRAMEPPRHDDFEPQRLESKDLKKGKAALRDIASWVREMLGRHARNPVSEETTIDELSEFFADETEDNNERKSRQGEVNPKGALIIRARPVNNKPKPNPLHKDEGTSLNPSDSGQGEEVDGTEPGGGNDDTNRAPGSNGGGGKPGGGGGDKPKIGGSGNGDSDITDSLNIGTFGGQSNVILENVRAVPYGLVHRQLSFATRYSGEISLRLQVSGADVNEPLSIVGTTVGEISNGHVHGIKVKSGQRLSINVTLGRPFTGAVRISASAI